MATWAKIRGWPSCWARSDCLCDVRHIFLWINRSILPPVDGRVTVMVKDQRSILKVLKAELAFLESGGYEYARKQDASWRPPFFLEDSPTCFHKWRGSVGERDCADCILMQLVPMERRGEAVPCRHIPLNSAGETTESFYKRGTQHELESVLNQWLRSQIKELQEQSSEAATHSTQ
jgi:hypothetical protein